MLRFNYYIKYFLFFSHVDRLTHISVEKKENHTASLVGRSFRIRMAVFTLYVDLQLQYILLQNLIGSC